MEEDCSLRIADLGWSDTGNYTVTLEVDPASQSPDKKPGLKDEFYEGSIYLQVSASNQFSIPVQCVPPWPNQGQEVTLTLQGIPRELESCEWFKAGPSGNLQPIDWYSPGEQQQDNHTISNKRVTVGRDCSLRITKLTTADSGNYTVKMEVFEDRQQHQPVNGTEPQGPGEIREHWGQVKLQVNQGSGTYLVPSGAHNEGCQFRVGK
uniref:Uncharacterized protein n=1 Tax=Sphaerodactylus townsendi TaxID=933632 RepID=A0ACB8FSE4_9SAUR